MTQAIFGLVGVVVGAGITAGMSFLVERRQEKRRAIVGLLLLEAELQRVSAVLYGALEHGVWTRDTDMEIRMWVDYGPTLAAELRRDDWNFLALGVYSAASVPRVFALQLAEDGEPVVHVTEADRLMLNGLLDHIQRAQLVVGKQLGQWPVETRKGPPPIPVGAFPPRPQ